MKAEVTIKDGRASIILRAENRFEEDLIEQSEENYTTETNILTNYSYGSHSKHRIEINLKRKTK